MLHTLQCFHFSNDWFLVFVFFATVARPSVRRSQIEKTTSTHSALRLRTAHIASYNSSPTNQLSTTVTSNSTRNFPTMPPKKKTVEDLGAMRAARFGRVKNDLSMGFVGLPNVGKSTLTNLLVGACHAEAANYPFCTIDPNVVRCTVPDQKFSYLAKTFKPPSVVPAVLKVVDIAGLIKGASEGAGLGNAFLSHIAAVDGIFHLVRAFDSDEVVHVDDSVDPIRDLETIEGELCLKDLATLETVLANEKSAVRKAKSLARNNEPTLSDLFQSAYDKSLELLQKNTPVQTGEFTSGEVELIKDWGLITTKPQVYVINLSKKNFIRKGSKWLAKISEWVKAHGDGQIIPMSCEFEQELFDMKDDPAAQKGK